MSKPAVRDTRPLRAMRSGPLRVKTPRDLGVRSIKRASQKPSDGDPCTRLATGPSGHSHHIGYERSGFKLRRRSKSYDRHRKSDCTTGRSEALRPSDPYPNARRYNHDAIK